MYGLRVTKNAFTLAETVIVCSVFAVMVVWIILMINRAYVFMNNTKISVMATNFAREWVEMVYNIRDTNRRKSSWMKDANWASGFYVFWVSNYFFDIKEKKDSNWNSTVFLDKIQITNNGQEGCKLNIRDEDEFFNYIDNLIDVCVEGRKIDKIITYSWTYLYYSGGEVSKGIAQDLFEWDTEFYRIVIIDGFYNKLNWSRIVPVNLNDEYQLKNWTPVEMRFCVEVFYRNHWNKHKTELCSIMTNFME